MSLQDAAYQPNPVPDDPEDVAALIQFLYDELYRISATLETYEERITALEP
ncbi:MAG: hypothetical protein ACR2P6_07590 [Gammaproteobacteria bacterium]